MKWISAVVNRVRVWLPPWRRKHTPTDRPPALREFVYLDEVSVYSLMASRRGPIAAEFTETTTVSRTDEIKSSIGAGMHGLRADVGAGSSSSSEHGSQVVSKSIVQTTFKHLYELEESALAVRPQSSDAKQPEVADIESLASKLESLEGDGWIVDPRKLTRGRLLEVEVQLEAETIFRVSSVVSAILEILEQSPEVFGVDRELIQIRTIDKILAKLLVGLVPIRGQALDYFVTKLDGKDWIIHARLLQELPTGHPLAVQPLFVVGVADESFFWKDIRRVLFSRARFRVMGRVGQDGLRDSWTPVKLVEVLRSISPDVADQVDSTGVGTLDTVIGTGKPAPERMGVHERMYSALTGYADLLAQHYGQTLTEEDQSEVARLAQKHRASVGSVPERRKAFGVIAKLIQERFDIQTDPLVLAQYRPVALADAGLDLAGQTVSAPVGDDSISPSPEGRFLDCEFVAIYW